MKESGIEFVREPVVASYGTVAVFRDLYGWDLVGPDFANAAQALPG